MSNHGSVFESDFSAKFKKHDVQGKKKDKKIADHVTQVCEGTIGGCCPSSACETNHRGIEGEHCSQCAPVKKCQEQHTLTKRQIWGYRTIVESEPESTVGVTVTVESKQIIHMIPMRCAYV